MKTPSPVVAALLASIALLALPVLAHAPPLEQLPDTMLLQAPEVTVQVTTVDWNKLLFEVVAGILALIATVVTGVLLPAGKAWLKAKAADADSSAATKAIVGATLKLDAFIEAGLAQAWTVFERDMRAAADPLSEGGSKITDGELKKAKDDVLAEVKKYLGTSGLTQLQDALGIGGDMVESFLKAQIEKKVQEAQSAGAAVSVMKSGQEVRP